jgi:hypothetical protein
MKILKHGENPCGPCSESVGFLEFSKDSLGP